MWKKYKKIFIGFGLGLAAAILISGAFWLDFFGTWQTKLTDKLFLKSLSRSDIVILAIDNKSLTDLGQWPWPREAHAKALLNLAASQPKVVGYDVIFSEASRLGPADDEALAAALVQLPVILPVEALPLQIKKEGAPEAENLIESISLISWAAKDRGHVNVVAEADGVVRRLPLFISGHEQLIPSFSLRLAGLANGQTSESMVENIGYWLRINFIGPPGSFKTISFSDVYNNNFSADDFKNKIVLVGVTSSDLHDEQMTPFSLGQAMAGVEIHANALQTILDQKFIKEVGLANVVFFIFFFSLLNALCFSLWQKIWPAVTSGVLSILAYLAASLIFFSQGWVLNLVYPVLSFVFSLIVILLYRYFSESREKSYLRQSFQYYMSPEVVEDVITNPEKLKLGGAKKDMTVLFSDIRGFTTLSEKVEPEKLVSLLNEYFTAMTEVLLAQRGVLDKFIGDAIMGFWGAPQEEPEHARRACETALAMMERLAVLKNNWVRRGLPEINIGIGVNSGSMIVGNMGSEKRFDYTVIGDNVNLASRLEGLNKQYNANIIISQFTYQRVKDFFECRYLDKVNVKGKNIPVEIYELLGRKK